MTSLYSHADANIRKTWLLIFSFLIFIIFLGWLFSYFLDSYVILIFAVIFSILMSIGSYWYSDKIVLSMVKAQPVEKKDNLELYRVVENLCITAGLPLPQIYIIEEKQVVFPDQQDPPSSGEPHQVLVDLSISFGDLEDEPNLGKRLPLLRRE